MSKLMEAGALIKNAFCGPCFGAGDTPAHGALSIRHSTRNFPNREGSKPGNGQVAGVALMDARSIAATAANAGRLTPATDLDWDTTSTLISPTISTPISTKSAATRAGAGPIPPWNSSTVPTSLTGRPWPLFPRICSSGSPASSPTP